MSDIHGHLRGVACSGIDGKSLLLVIGRNVQDATPPACHTKRMSYLLALLLTASSPATASASACGTELEAARQAYGTYDVVTARRRYARVADGACQPTERAEAATELARIIWLVDGDGPAAVAWLRTVPTTEREGCAAAAILGRVLTKMGRAIEVAPDLTPALPVCADLDPAVALAVVDASVRSAADAPPVSRVKAARAGLALWHNLSLEAQATLQGGRARLALGLLARDAGEATAGWRAFFAMNGGLAGSQLPARLGKVLRDGLAPRADEEPRETLCDALIRAGFADEARRLMDATTATAPVWRSARAYFQLREELQALLTAHDRAYAAGDRSGEAGLEEAILEILRRAIASAGHLETDPWQALQRLWNLVGTTGRSNGVEGLHLGHVSTDLDLTVIQGNRRGIVHFVALDNMVANGFSGWLGDGVTGPGGWAANGRMIQVRTRYVQTALERAAIAVPGPARDAFVARLVELEAADLAKRDPSPSQFMPGLSARLQLSAVDALAAELRRTSADASPLRSRIATLWYARSFEGTILHHEGRHALDQIQFRDNAALRDPELEFRAKLSELTYSTSPNVAFSNIYGRLLGGATGHGTANLRLVVALAAWLSEHGHEIPGFDPSVRPLLQLWRLDDRHLREIARGLDPAERHWP